MKTATELEIKGLTTALAAYEQAQRSNQSNESDVPLRQPRSTSRSEPRHEHQNERVNATTPQPLSSTRKRNISHASESPLSKRQHLDSDPTLALSDPLCGFSEVKIEGIDYEGHSSYAIGATGATNDRNTSSAYVQGERNHKTADAADLDRLNNQYGPTSLSLGVKFSKYFYVILL